jgi:hypothetical protein
MDALPKEWLDAFTMPFFEVPKRPGEIWIKGPRLGRYDPTGPASLSRAYRDGRRWIDPHAAMSPIYPARAYGAK